MALSALVVPQAVWAQATGAGTRPNIVVLLADDLGYRDLGIQGSPDFAALTPAIDSLATGGVRFTSGYVSGPVCSPTRAGLLTGRYQQRYGHENNPGPNDVGLPLTQHTMADTLRAAGYRTYCVGKWHLGDAPAYHPNQRGFDEFFGFLEGARSYYATPEAGEALHLQRNGTPVPELPGMYLTDRLGQEAAAYIDRHVVDYPDQPFFLYLAFNAVHAPMEADDARLADPRVAAIPDPNRRILGAMTLAMDDAVGLVLSTLIQRGLDANTLMVFLSDNGGPEDTVPIMPNYSDNGPLRGTKGYLYEGGVRVPFFIRWPARVPAGRIISDPVIQLDLLPTFAAAAGAALLPGQTVDGVDLLPRLSGATTVPPHPVLFWRSSGSTQGQSALRMGDWKLVRADAIGGGTVELFNLAADIGETTDLASVRPDRVATLLEYFDAWENSVIEPLWGNGMPEITGEGVALGASELGYALVQTGDGAGSAVFGRRYPLDLAQDWDLVFFMDCREEPGLRRNGFVLLGDSAEPARMIGLGVLATPGTLRIVENATGASTSLEVSAIPPGAAEYRIRYRSAGRTLSLALAGHSVSHRLTGAYGSLTHTGFAVARASTHFSHPVPAPAVAVAPDLDGDGDVDLADFTGFQACYNGPNRAPGTFCAADADFDGDADVDLADFAAFQACFAGPNQTPNCQ